jgi:Tfp pilus assembly protein PilF
MFTKVAFDNEGNSSREQTTQVLVQTDAGVQQWGLLTFPFQSATQTVEIDYVRVRKPDGTTLITPPDNFQDLDSEITRSAPFYSDLREKHAAVKGLAKGDTLEYQAHWRDLKPLIPGQFWLQYNFQHSSAVLDERIEIKVPAGRAVKVKGPEATQKEATDSISRIYSWTFSQPQKPQPESGTKKEVDAALGLAPAPDVQISSFQSWEEVGRWYWNLQKERAEPTSAIRAKAAELTQGLSDDSAKLRAIYAFVSTHYRYIGISFGIGRYQPHAAEDVLTNNYGDCKDKHTLLASLLQASGITVYPALISSKYKVDTDLPSPAQFDHIIGYMPPSAKGSAIWLDTTPEVGPVGYLVPQLRDKPALVMPGSQPSQLITTPADPPVPNSLTFKISAKLADDGTLDAKMERTDLGDTEVLLRSAFRKLGESDWKELMQRISYSTGYAGTVSDVRVSSPEAIAEPLHISYTYSRKDYPDWTNHHVTPMPALYFLPPVQEDDSQPKQPVYLGSPLEVISEATMEMPKGYTPKAPAAVDLKYDFAEYHSSYSQANGVLTVHRRLLSKVKEVSIAQLADYKTFSKKMQDDANQYVEMDSTANGSLPAATLMQQKGLEYRAAVEALPASSDPEATRSEQDAMDAMNTYDVVRAENSLKKALQLDPKFTRARLRLAALFLSLAAKSDAISTLKEAINADPTQPLGYRILAFSAASTNHPDDAIYAWQGLLQVVPNDADATASLGPLLMMQKRYSEAVPYLEAVAKNDTSPSAQLELGSAYLRSGQVEKGTALLEKIVTSNATPMILNDAAYELADLNADPVKALDLAQKAVEKQETDSHELELSSLLPDDLACTVRIGYVWDTLGWAEFRAGHLDEAEDYLKAAWLLQQVSVVADHLGQVYEQKKEIQKAIHMYRLALSASDAYPTDGFSNPALAHLQHLAGKRAGTMADPAYNSGAAELSQMRSVKLRRLAPGSESAEFFLLFTHGSTIEDLQFISGSNKLRAAEDALYDAEFPVAFPRGSSARIVRRAIVSCSPVSGCMAVLLDPNSVKSLN